MAKAQIRRAIAWVAIGNRATRPGRGPGQVSSKPPTARGCAHKAFHSARACPPASPQPRRSSRWSPGCSCCRLPPCSRPLRQTRASAWPGRPCKSIRRACAVPVCSPLVPPPPPPAPALPLSLPCTPPILASFHPGSLAGAGGAGACTAAAAGGVGARTSARAAGAGLGAAAPAGGRRAGGRAAAAARP